MMKIPLLPHSLCAFLLLVVLSFTVGGTTLTCQAQSQSQRAGISSLIGGAAKTIYTLAWPTANYRDWSLHSIDPVAGGFDVVVTLDGRSGLDGSDLWLQLKVELRSDGIHDYSVLRHNAFWREPFATVRDGVSLAAAMQQSMAEQAVRDKAAASARADAQASAAAQARAVAAAQAKAQADATAPAPSSQVVAACLSNTTDALINLEYRSAVDTDWQPATIKPGKALSIYSPYTGTAAPSLSVRYGGYTDGVVHTYRIERLVAPVPLACGNAMQYQFARQGDDLLIFKSE